MVRKLLTEANARSSVEGAEDEWVWRQVFMHPFIKESVRVKFESFEPIRKMNMCRILSRYHTIWTPKISSTMKIDDTVHATGEGVKPNR